MKIISYIQKIFAVLFLSLLTVSCTDEMIDRGGSTTPIEEGKLVNVSLTMEGSSSKTVVTRSMDDDDEPGIDDLVVLQYQGGELKHAWYTDLDEDDRVENDYEEIEGWGSQTTLKNVQLLSGTGYQVFIVSGLNLDGDDDVYYSGIKIQDPKNGNIYTGKQLDDQHGVILLDDGANVTFFSHFGTLAALNSWKRSQTNHRSLKYPDEEDVMLAVVSNGAMTDGKNYDADGNKVYRYTKMFSSFDQKDLVNDAVPSNSVNITGNKETDKLCATFYPPYAKVSLTIDNKTGIKIVSAEIVNCPEDYSLVNGYVLNDNSAYTKAFFDKSKSKSKSNSVYVYENMAGVLNNASGEKGKVPPAFNNGNYEDAAKGYTYIKVKGKYESSSSRKHDDDDDDDNKDNDITYRFILGKDNYANCNVERNVHYKVTMTLAGNGGIDETSWRVEYEKDKPEKPITIDANLSRLDAHATVTPITFNNLKAGTYFFEIEKSNGSIKNHGGSLYSVKSDNATIKNGSTGNKLEFEVDGFQNEVIINYLQNGWFENTWNDSQGHKKEKPAVVAAEQCNEYTVNVYYENGSQDKIGSITIKQYPPIVVYQDPIISSDGNPVILNRWSNVTYMERFDDDHDAVPERYDFWAFPDFSEQNQSLNYPQRLFNANEKENSEVCYWLNPYGPLDYKNGKYTKVPNSVDAWMISLSSQSTQRYIVQMAIINN